MDDVPLGSTALDPVSTCVQLGPAMLLGTYAPWNHSRSGLLKEVETSAHVGLPEVQIAAFGAAVRAMLQALFWGRRGSSATGKAGIPGSHVDLQGQRLLTKC